MLLHVQAQGVLPGGFEHVIDVTRYSDWGKEYLTITDMHSIGIPGDDYYPLTFEFLDNETFSCGYLVIEVDGESAKGWTPSQFYSKVDNRHDVIILKLRKKSGDRLVKIRPIYELPDRFKPFADEFRKLKITSGKEERESHYKQNQQGIVNSERYDNDFDFFACETYDYLITSNDPLLDKSILDGITKAPGFLANGMKRDEKNPDIIFTIARNAEESISTTYVPPTSRTVNVGSKTTTQYNYILKQNEYITTQKNRTITEGGYTQETKTADLFLEIAALDAKRVNDSNMTHPPVVCQGTTKRHVVNPTFDYEDELMSYASWYTFPPVDRIAFKVTTIYAPLGVICDSTDPKIIATVKSGSRAEKLGLRSGDKLIKADAGKWNKDISKDSKKNGWKTLEEWPSARMRNIDIEILRDGKKMKLIITPLSLEVMKYCWK